MFETDPDRAYALLKRRCDILSKIKKDISHQTYQTYIMEVTAELTDIYTDMHDVRMTQVQTGKTKMTAEWLLEQNRYAREVILNSKYIVGMIYKSEDKFSYLQGAINMELKAANMYSKIVENDKSKQIENVKNSLECHKAVRKFVDEYKKFKEHTSDADLTETI